MQIELKNIFTFASSLFHVMTKPAFLKPESTPTLHLIKTYDTAANAAYAPGVAFRLPDQD